jgi:glycosyltransferase involved in cell wall biosynthesis
MKTSRACLPNSFFERVLFQLIWAENLQHLLCLNVSAEPRLAELVATAFSRRAEPARLSWIEADPEALEAANAALADLPGVQLFAGWGQPPAHWPGPQELETFYWHAGSDCQRFPLKFWLARSQSQQQLYRQTRVCDQLARVRAAQGPADAVLLNGSDFTGSPDFHALRTARLLILTGIDSFRNYGVFQALHQDPNHRLMYHDRSAGCAVFFKPPPLQPGISVVIHTRNEEAKLPACLESVQTLAERIVIDMESTDQTVAIARAAGARVIPHLTQTFVDEARNFGLAQAHCRWTLVLDADERVPPALLRRLEALASADGPINGYWLPRNNIFFGQCMENLFPDYQLRFFRTGTASWSGTIHEFARLEGPGEKLPAEREAALQHFSYDSVAHFVRKQLYYATQTTAQYHQATGPAVSTAAIRREFTRALTALPQGLDQLSDSEWLTHTLYFFANYLNGAALIESLGLSAQRPAGVFLSAYSYLKNGIEFDYPFRESILSVLPLCDEMVIGWARDSSDGTAEALAELAAQHPKIKLFASDVWRENQGDKGSVIRRAAEEAMARCRGEWLWHVQADEVYHEADLKQLEAALYSSESRQIAAFNFPILHFYGSPTVRICEKGREIGWYQTCVRLARRGATQHIEDAWTQMPMPGVEGRLQLLPVRIFHYGHVRQPEAMRLKSSYMEQLYAPLPTDFEICPTGSFRYDRVDPAYLERYDDEHPRVMRLRMARQRLAQARAQTRKPSVLLISRHHRIKKGFGITLHEVFATGLLQRGFEIHQLAWHYTGPDTCLDGIHIYGCPNEDSFGVRKLSQLLTLIAPDIVWLHADPHFFLEYLPILKAWQGCVVGWFPIDYARVNNPVTLLPLLRRCQRMASLSRYGLEQLARNYRGPLAVVPLGVNSQTFFPANPGEKRRLREALKWRENDFVFVTVANNFWRKGIEYAIEAMHELRMQFPELAQRAFLYLHTEPNASLIELISAYQLEDRIQLSKDFDPYQNPFSEARLCELYQASDAFLLTSLAEGFGMPLLEAQACGLPVLAPNHSSIPEVVGEAGLTYAAEQKIFGQNAECIVWLNVPDTADAARQMAELMRSPELCQRLGQQGLLQSREAHWERTTLLLFELLSESLGQGQPVFEYPEPELFRV